MYTRELIFKHKKKKNRTYIFLLSALILSLVVTSFILTYLYLPFFKFFF